MKSVCQCALLAACAFVGLFAVTAAQGADSESTSFLAHRLQPFQMRSEREAMNKILSRILDLTYEMYKDMGASQADLKELHHKRGVIQTCYFQAVSCY